MIIFSRQGMYLIREKDLSLDTETGASECCDKQEYFLHIVKKNEGFACLKKRKIGKKGGRGRERERERETHSC